MKRWVLAIVLFLIIVCSGCGQKSMPLQELTGEEFIMDTLVQITVICEDQEQGRKALQKAFAAYERINNLTDRFPKGEPAASSSSDVIRLNENAGTKPVKVSADTIKIIQRSCYYASLTGGSFDVSIGPVVDRWAFGKSKQCVPTDEEISKALSLVDYSKVEVDPCKATVFLPKPEIGRAHV